MSGPETVQTPPLVSDDRIRDVLRRELGRAINVERRFTRPQLANESGVNVYTIDSILSRDPAKHRRVALADALSLCQVLGERAINALLAPICFVARPLDEGEIEQPMLIVAGAMRNLSVIADAAADGRIDHVEKPRTTEAADMIIATVLPLSSAGKGGE